MNAKSSRRTTVIAAGLVSATVFAIYIIGSILQATLSAQDGTAKAAEAEEAARDNYFPNTELLGTDEMRVTALGTGTPNFRRSQASASWLVELGNGEKFIFSGNWQADRCIGSVC